VQVLASEPVQCHRYNLACARNKNSSV